METFPDKKPVIRFQRNFIVEENLSSIQWPQECAVCGGAVELKDDLSLKGNFKSFGKINVDVKGIPYCNHCFGRVKRGKSVNRLQTIMTWVLGIPIGIALIILGMSDSRATVVWMGLLLLIGVGIGYGLSWLIIKLPTKIFGKRILEPVDAWLIEEKKIDNREGISISLSIPSKAYAAKFAALNGVVLS